MNYVVLFLNLIFSYHCSLKTTLLCSCFLEKCGVYESCRGPNKSSLSTLNRKIQWNILQTNRCIKVNLLTSWSMLCLQTGCLLCDAKCWWTLSSFNCIIPFWSNICCESSTPKRVLACSNDSCTFVSKITAQGCPSSRFCQGHWKHGTSRWILVFLHCLQTGY